MIYNLIRTKLHIRKPSKCRLQSTDKLCFQLAVNFFSRIFILHITAYICVEQQWVTDPIRINTRASYCYINIQTYLRIYNTEWNWIWRTEFIINQLFCIKIINTLIFTCIATKCKSFSDCCKCL